MLVALYFKNSSVQFSSGTTLPYSGRWTSHLCSLYNKH